MYDFLSSIADFVGLTGVVVLLLAYFAISTGRIKSSSMVYQLMNFTAAWLILYSLMFHWNTPSVVIEIAWIMISVIGMIRIVSRKKR